MRARAVHAESWRGLAFGVFTGRSRYRDEPDVNFHGLILAAHLPTVHPVGGPAFSVRADVGDCPELELVLPARKEAVETPFLDEMREAASTAIYRAIAAADSAPAIAFQDWKRARAAGVELSAPALRPWRPPVADTDNWLAGPAPEPLPTGALVMDVDFEAPEAQSLWRAAERGGMAPRLFETDRRFEGYGWYDTLPRVTGVQTRIVGNGEVRPLVDYQTPPVETPPRPDAIRVKLDVYYPDGTNETLALDADLAFAGEAWAWLSDVRPLVTAGSAIEPAELAGILRDAFFSPSDESDADSWETQRTRFEEEAMHLALSLLCSEEEARRRSIACAVRRELSWLIPRDRAVTITVRDGEVGVEFSAGEAAR